MMKRDLTLLSIGLFVWVISGVILYPPVVRLVVHQGYPAFLNEIFFFFQYIIIGFGVGFLGKHRGWMLGLFLGVLITICFVIFSLTSPVNEFGNQKFGNISAILLSHSIFTIYLIVGGYFGELVRKRYKK